MPVASRHEPGATLRAASIRSSRACLSSGVHPTSASGGAGSRSSRIFQTSSSDAEPSLSRNRTNAACCSSTVLDGIEPEDAHRAALRPQQTQNMFDERRLARAVGADEAVDRSAWQGQAHLGQGRPGTEAARQLRDVDDRMDRDVDFRRSPLRYLGKRRVRHQKIPRKRRT
jgi:hypothetical protein